MPRIFERVDATELVELSHTPVTDPRWRPYLRALEKALPLDERRYPAGVIDVLMRARR